MFLIAGFSDSRDGIASIVGADNRNEALQKFVDNWNFQFENEMQLVTTDDGEYLIGAEFDPSVVDDFNDCIPGSEGFSLEITVLVDGQINTNMPW